MQRTFLSRRAVGLKETFGPHNKTYPHPCFLLQPKKLGLLANEVALKCSLARFFARRVCPCVYVPVNTQHPAPATLCLGMRSLTHEKGVRSFGNVLIKLDDQMNQV